MNCAEKQERYDECTNLSICVEPNTRTHECIATRYSPEFYEVGLFMEMLENNTCNVIAAELLQLLKMKIFNPNDVLSQKYVIGDTTFTNEPLAIVTRNNDRTWSDIVNWTIQALIYGQRHGIGKDESLCQTDVVATSSRDSTSFLNAVYCVGNYDEIVFSDQYGDFLRTETNSINNGTGNQQLYGFFLHLLKDLDFASQMSNCCWHQVCFMLHHLVTQGSKL